jgi:hypothetical protein
MSKTLYVWNLPAATTETGLRNLFRRYGQISSARVLRTAAALTEATVVMTDDSAADEAVHALPGPRIGLRSVDFGLKQRRSYEVSWDGRSGGLRSESG